MNAQSKLQDAAPPRDPDGELARLFNRAQRLVRSLERVDTTRADADAEVARLCEEQNQVFEEIVQLRPRTIFGLAAKANAAQLVNSKTYRDDVVEKMTEAVAADANRLSLAAASENPGSEAVLVDPEASRSRRPASAGALPDLEQDLYALKNAIACAKSIVTLAIERTDLPSDVLDTFFQLDYLADQQAKQLATIHDQYEAAELATC